MCDWGNGTEDMGEGWEMPEKQESYCTVIGKAETSETSGRCRRERVGFSSITSINMESGDCQSKEIPVSKTNLREHQDQEAGGHLRVLFSSQTYH